MSSAKRTCAKPINVFEICAEPGSNKKSKYHLRDKELWDLVEPIKDMEVAIVGVIGKARRGKSFLLNYMQRYLNDPTNINWMGKQNEPLEGFQWLSSDDPQTFGIWLSRPTVLKQSNGKELAVILMDTQGLFDDIYTERDWSTIVGISLFISSTLIVNLFTNISEEMLTFFDKYIKYGLRATKENENKYDCTPFQNLMFLVRDWNNPNVNKHGMTGGKQYLEKKLIIRDEQSDLAQNVRTNIKKCFADISCFLMPQFGEVMENKEFNGCVGQLKDRFKEKLKEFVVAILNPEEMVPKMLNGVPITGEGLFEQFKSLIEVFNNEEPPDTDQLMEALAKMEDSIFIRKLRDSHLIQIRNFIESKPFVTRKHLEDQHQIYKTECIDDFENSMKSCNTELSDHLSRVLNENYPIVYKENEERRVKYLEKCVESCGKQFIDLINKEFEDKKFIESQILEDIFKTNTENVLVQFKECFCGEDEEVFIKDCFDLNKIIDNYKTELREENYRKINHFKDSLDNKAANLTEYYEKKMNKHFEESVYLPKEKFRELEAEVRDKTKNKIKNDPEFSELSNNESFILKVELKLRELKVVYKENNQKKCETVFNETKVIVAKAIENYKQEVSDRFDLFNSIEDLDKIHETILKKSTDILNTCPFQEPDFFNNFSKIFDNKINELYNDFKTQLIEKKEMKEKKYQDALSDAFELYKQELTDSIENENFVTIDDMNRVHKSHRKSALEEYDRHFDGSTSLDPIYRAFQLDLKERIDEEYDKHRDSFQTNIQNTLILESLVKDYEQKYEELMTNKMDSFVSLDTFKEFHIEIKGQLISDFKEECSTEDSDVLKLFTESLDINFEKTRKQFEYLLGLRLDKEQALLKNLNQETRRAYKEEMDRYSQKKLFVPKQEILNNHLTVIKNIVDKYSQQRGQLSEEAFDELVKDSVSDILSKIIEENEMKRPTESVAIGIDLGTTNSCVAYFDPKSKNNNILVIPNEMGNNTTPSIVSFRDKAVVIVGDVAKEDIHAYPRNTILSSKRLIGRNFNDSSVQKDIGLYSYKVIDGENGNPKVSVKVDGREQTYFPEQISAEVLKKMKKIAETHLGCSVTKAVITVPAYFNDAQREATKDAGKIAKLDVLRIINEPTAAAIAFKVDLNVEQENRKVLIYDLGGGTFDVSILEINKGVINVLAVGGDNHLGGDDFDTNVINYCLEQFENENHFEVRGVEGEGAMCRLRSQCEFHKRRLSAIESTVISIDDLYQKKDLRVVLTRNKFEELNHEFFVKTLDLVEQTLKEKEILPTDIDDIVLVGGSTRIPKIMELLSQKFGGRPLNHSVNPDEAVAKGAAIQAALLNGKQSEGLGDLVLKDVTPLSLGIRLKGGLMSVIIPRNTTVPTQYTRQYVTSDDYQTIVGIAIFEGEEKMTNDNHLLGQFDLCGIPSAPRGQQSIDVTFDLNEEGILHVKAKIISTGSEDQIEITEHKGRLSRDVINQLTRDNSFSSYSRSSY